MKELLTQKEHLTGDDPFDKMEEMRAFVEKMPDGDDKAEYLLMYNQVAAIFTHARTNEGLRNMLADIFTAQRDYYKNKAEKVKLVREWKMLSKLHDEQEDEEIEKKKMERRAKREQEMLAKSKEKAEKRKEKDEASAAKRRK